MFQLYNIITVYILDRHKKNIIYMFDAKFAQYHKEERKTANIILDYRQVLRIIFCHKIRFSSEDYTNGIFAIKKPIDFHTYKRI